MQYKTHLLDLNVNTTLDIRQTLLVNNSGEFLHGPSVEQKVDLDQFSWFITCIFIIKTRQEINRHVKSSTKERAVYQTARAVTWRILMTWTWADRKSPLRSHLEGTCTSSSPDDHRCKTCSSERLCGSVEKCIMGQTLSDVNESDVSELQWTSPDTDSWSSRWSRPERWSFPSPWAPDTRWPVTSRGIEQGWWWWWSLYRDPTRVN